MTAYQCDSIRFGRLHRIDEDALAPDRRDEGGELGRGRGDMQGGPRIDLSGAGRKPVNGKKEEQQEKAHRTYGLAHAGDPSRPV